MKLLVIRGDLQSQSGYSAAARDYCALLKCFFDKLVGVDIHFSGDRPYEAFPFPIVTEDEARKLATQASFVLVLSFTTPDRYLRYDGAVNVGLTFWETDRLPLLKAERSPWVEQANTMDAIWAPSSHTREVFEAAGVTIPIRVIPWPIKPPGRQVAELPDGEVYDLDRSPAFAQLLASLGQFQMKRFRWSRWLRDHAAPRAAKALLSGLQSSPRAIAEPRERAFLCVAQDVPRKALLLFLSEWMEFKRRPEAGPWSLILKTTPINPQTSRFEIIAKFWQHVQALKRQLDVESAKIHLWTGNIASADFERLMLNTFAQVAPSLGEGFCGPAAATLQLGKPLIAPRHTAFGDYIPEDYPYTFATRAVRLSFARDPLKVYDPASAWHVPEPLALADALSRLVKETPERRVEIGWRSSAHFTKWCNPERVAKLLHDEIEAFTRSSLIRAA